MSNLSHSALQAYSLPWFSALQIGCLVLAASIHQHPHLLRPAMAWLGNR